MKKLLYSLGFIILASFASYSQNVYQHFSELNGMEDYNGNTNLLYRINSVNQDIIYYTYSNSIYLLNVSDRSDSGFQSDYVLDYSFQDSQVREVIGYDFWEKNPHKFIVCGVGGMLAMFEPAPIVDRFDRTNLMQQYWGEANFIRISRKNDSLVYCTFKTNINVLFKSTTGGFNWDIVSNFNAVSLSPYNDKVLFAFENDTLFKTTDGGITQKPVLTNYSYMPLPHLFLYDKDTNYIYTSLWDNGIYNLLVSNNSGENNSWQSKFTSPVPIYVSIDYSAAGSVYMATGKNIFISTDFGNTFSPVRTLDRKLIGIYKKPGSSKLYAATESTIYEIDGLNLNVVKQIPIDKEIFKFDPLEQGNKWVYQGQRFEFPDGSFPIVQSREVVKDTILANQQIFKQIKTKTMYSIPVNIFYTYERIDSSNGKVYFWHNYNGVEYQADDLSILPGDNINVSRINIGPQTTSFDTLNTKTIFGQSKDNRVYATPTSIIGYGSNYNLTKDFGMTYQKSIEGDIGGTIYVLKGAIINGVLYGDTTFIVGIKDKLPDPPSEFSLAQNYPNPFNPSTKIRYSIIKSGIVTLKVYDILGKEVAVLVNSKKEPGSYEVNFDASASGRLSSGIYFYELRYEMGRITKKMIFIK
jgi:hypothetical protein